MQLMLAQKCAECRPDAFQMQVPTAIDLPRLLPPKRLDSLHPPTLLSRDVDGRSRQRRMSQVLLRNLNGHPTGNRMACMGVPHPMGTC